MNKTRPSISRASAVLTITIRHPHCDETKKYPDQCRVNSHLALKWLLILFHVLFYGPVAQSSCSSCSLTFTRLMASHYSLFVIRGHHYDRKSIVRTQHHGELYKFSPNITIPDKVPSSRQLFLFMISNDSGRWNGRDSSLSMSIRGNLGMKELTLLTPKTENVKYSLCPEHLGNITNISNVCCLSVCQHSPHSWKSGNVESLQF
jgi:hypothetical protein